MNAITIDGIPRNRTSGRRLDSSESVYGDDDKPITGVYRVTAIAGNVVTVGGLAAMLTQPSGTLRRDAMAFYF